MLTGVYLATKKDKTVYYRSNITHKGRHISLGSFPSEVQAHQAYTAACELLSGTETIDEAFYRTNQLAFEKIVSLINFRDNHMYIPTPIYLRKNYFSYYLSIHRELKFDIDDLFYYSSHRILTRQGHLYVNHYGMQLTLLGRYGIKTHAVNGRDFCFVNGDENDFRYSNLKIINPYFGVERIDKNGTEHYKVRIHIHGNITVGNYTNAIDAAIAYNKAVDLAHQAGISKNFPENYIEELSASSYADIYQQISLICGEVLSDIFLLFLVDIIDKTFAVNNLLHKWWKCLSLEFLSGCHICDDSGIKIYFHLIPCLYFLCGLWALNDRQTDIDGIPVKDSGKCLSNDTADTGCLDGNRCMFTGRTTSKVFIGYNNISHMYIFYEIFIDIFHTVCGKFFRIGRIQISCRNDNIRIYVIAIFKYTTMCCFHFLSDLLFLRHLLHYFRRA